MTLNRNKPPLNFRSRRHTEKYIFHNEANIKLSSAGPAQLEGRPTQTRRGDPPQTGGATHPDSEGRPTPNQRLSLSLQLCLCQRETALPLSKREGLRFGVGRPSELRWVSPLVWGGSPLPLSGASRAKPKVGFIMKYVFFGMPSGSEFQRWLVAI